MPLFNPPPSAAPTWEQMTAGPLAFYGKTPSVAQPGAYTAGYATASKAVGSYAAADRSAAYTEVPLALLNAARSADLNDLRVAVENLRLFTESVAQNHNATVADLKALGLFG